MEFKAQDGQTIFDLAISSGYAIDDIYSFIQQNPIIDSIDFPVEITPGIVISYVPMPTVSADVSKQSKVPTTSIKTMLAFDGQSIYDLCQMAGYGLEQIYQFLQDNQIDSVNEGTFQGKVFSFDTTLIADNILYNQLVNNRLVINTSGDDSPAYRVLATETRLIIITEAGVPILIT